MSALVLFSNHMGNTSLSEQIVERLPFLFAECGGRIVDSPSDDAPYTYYTVVIELLSTAWNSLFGQLDYRSLRSAADAVMLPQLEPRTMRQHFIVPSVRSRDVACAEWSNVRSFEHFLELLNVIDNAFSLHD